MKDQIKDKVMNKDKSLPVEQTFYNSYFEDINKTIFLLSKESARYIWKKKIDSGTSASSYFKLPKDSWININKATNLGEWVSSYNNDTNYIVENILRNAFDWKDEESIIFFINDENALKTEWQHFLKYWDSFLAVESDSPLIVSENLNNKELLSFTSTDMILKFNP